MKNLQGKQEDLKLYNKKGDLVYKFYKSSNGDWYESTYDDNGNELTFKHSDGDWRESTYDDNCNRLTFKSSEGNWSECTYDDKGNELTHKSSKGVSRTYNIPKYTIK